METWGAEHLVEFRPYEGRFTFSDVDGQRIGGLIAGANSSGFTAFRYLDSVWQQRQLFDLQAPIYAVPEPATYALLIGWPGLRWLRSLETPDSRLTSAPPALLGKAAPE